MKLSGLTLAALAAGTLFAAGPAMAQHHVEVQRTTTTTTTHNGGVYVEHRTDRHVNHRRQVCRTRWVNHHRVRRCYWR